MTIKIFKKCKNYTAVTGGHEWMLCLNVSHAWMLVILCCPPPIPPSKNVCPPQICWPLAQIFCQAKIILLPTPTFFTPPPHFAPLPFPILFLFIFYFFWGDPNFVPSWGTKKHQITTADSGFAWQIIHNSEADPRPGIADSLATPTQIFPN